MRAEETYAFAARRLAKFDAYLDAVHSRLRAAGYLAESGRPAAAVDDSYLSHSRKQRHNGAGRALSGSVQDFGERRHFDDNGR